MKTLLFLMNNKWQIVSMPYALILLLTINYFLLTGTPVFAADSDIVINEIAAAEKTGHEWFEIYNKGTTSVDLTNWKVLTDATTHKLTAYRGDFIIDPGEYAVIADVASQTEKDYPQFKGTLLDSSWSSLLNDGMLLGLQNGKGDIIEFFIYQPMKKYSLERKDPLEDDSLSKNWAEHPTGNTIGAVNSVYQAPPPPPPAQNQPQQPIQAPSTDTPPSQSQMQKQTSLSSPLILPLPGDVVINEFVPDPSDEEKEWVELYNTTQREISLTGWTLEDGSKKKIQLNGTLGFVDTTRFIVVEMGDNVLNNGGDRIILRDSMEQVIDDVSYGSWNDGDIKNNAPTAHDPHSIARIGDGVNTFNNVHDFQITTTPTRGSSNIVTKEDDVQSQDKKMQPLDIFISEVYPNPMGTNPSDEFIELVNSGNDPINLLHWELEVGSGRRYMVREIDFQSTVIQPHAFFVIPRSVSTLALRNKGGDTLSLFKPDTTRAVAKITYREKADPGDAYIRLQDGTYDWSLQPTPGEQNRYMHKNREPNIIIDAPKEAFIGDEAVFDASDTSDSDNDKLSFTWNFGVGEQREGIVVKYVFQKEGVQKISLTVSDSTHKVQKEVSLHVKKKETTSNAQEKVEVTVIKNDAKNEIVSTQALSVKQFILNEVLPNPSGKDTNEFIELKNISSDPIDNSHFGILLNGSGKKFYLSSGITPPNDFLLLSKNEYHFSLRNTKDVVSLINKTNTQLDSVSYEKAPSGSSYSRTQDGQWQWVKQPTPGSENVGNESKISEIANSVLGEGKFNAALDIRSLPTRSLVEVKGAVSVAPHVLSQSFFYLADPAIQVYSSSQSFPSLKEGDMVHVQGVMSTNNGEKRIRVTENDSIKFLSHSIPPEPHHIQLSDISEDQEGQFVAIAGEVVDARMPHYVLEKGDDSARIFLRKIAHIQKPDIRIGDSVQVKGIVSKVGDEYQVLPRYKEDIALLERKRSVDTTAKTIEALGENTTTQNQTMQYIIATAATLLAIGVGLFIQYKQGKK